MDLQAHGYTDVAFHAESKGIVIYFIPKDGSGKGTVLNINHDIVPQAIDKTLTGVSPGKDISNSNATQHTTTLEEGRNKREKQQNKGLIYPTLSQLELRLG
jgi:hypothetical protein